MKTLGFQWHLTDRCNLRCLHCYQQDFSPRAERSPDDLRLMADRIFSTMEDASVSVNLTGGEPLLLPHLLSLIEHLHSYASLAEANIITNATVVPDTLLDALGRLPKLRGFKVSIESGDAAVNDRIRGPGNLARVEANLRQLRARTDRQLILMNTLGRYNLASIPQTIGFARETGAGGVIFERFVPLGQGRAMRDQVLDHNDWAVAVSAIAQAAAVDPNETNLLAYRAFWLWLDGRPEKLAGALCNLGDEALALMPDGTVYPCRRLEVPVGNVLGDPLARIFERLRTFRVEAMRPRLHGELCGMCPIEECAGCRALAWALDGDMLADDPQCPLRAP